MAERKKKTQVKYKSYPSKYNFHDVYIYFMENERKKGRKELTWNNFGEKEFRAICKRFNELLIEDVLEGRSSRIPYGLGRIVVKAIPVNFDKLKVDFNSTKLAGKTMYYTGTDTGGYYCKIVFNWARGNLDTKWTLFDRIRTVGFKAASPVRKSVSKAFRENYKKFRKS